ncbi:MAG: MarR family transcriptional regulator [Pseudonocardia sp.]|nr:MarR family transcriptional regulator [Pseudonocardia sp.]
MDERLVSEVIGALTAWTVGVVQFNGMIAARMGVTDTALQCLYELSRQGPSTPGELARRVNLTSGAASRMVERLQEAGYVRRVPDPHDRRRVVVEPTPDAQVVGRYYTPLTDRLRDHLRHLDDDQLAAFLRFATHAQDATAAEIRNLASGTVVRGGRPAEGV